MRRARGHQTMAVPHVALVWLALFALAGLVASLLVTPEAAARGDDVCPEENDLFQAACYLGAESDALGFISGREDVDGYRCERTVPSRGTRSGTVR